MRSYEEFVSRLKGEILDADLGRSQIRFDGLAKLQRRAVGTPLRLALAAALLIAAGVGGYAGYSAYDGRRLLREDNRLFVDAVLSRGLFEVEAVARHPLDGILDWMAAPGSAD